MTLPSEIKELHERIKQCNIEKEQIGTVILMEINGIINRADFLTNEQKTKLLELIWKGRKQSYESR